MESANEETKIAEETAGKSNESLTKLDIDMKNVSVQYLEISEHARIAYEAADKALRQAAFAETANERLKVSGFILRFALMVPILKYFLLL